MGRSDSRVTVDVEQTDPRYTVTVEGVVVGTYRTTGDANQVADALCNYLWAKDSDASSAAEDEAMEGGVPQAGSAPRVDPSVSASAINQVTPFEWSADSTSAVGPEDVSQPEGRDIASRQEGEGGASSGPSADYPGTPCENCEGKGGYVEDGVRYPCSRCHGTGTPCPSAGAADDVEQQLRNEREAAVFWQAKYEQLERDVGRS